MVSSSCFFCYTHCVAHIVKSDKSFAGYRGKKQIYVKGNNTLPSGKWIFRNGQQDVIYR